LGIVGDISPNSFIADLHDSGFNDFDSVFLEFGGVRDGGILDAHAVSYLSLWVAKTRVLSLLESSWQHSRL
jgi:hypothetical protein